MDQSWDVFRSKLKSFILSKVQDSDDADDILQEVFIRMHTRIDSLKEKEKLQPWLFQITRNLISDHYRMKKKIISFSTNDVNNETDDTDQEIIQEATRDMIQMMENLPPEYCEALCLTELQGMSQTDYATKTGIPYSTAKSRVQRSRTMLRNMLMRCCHYEFDKYGTVLSIAPAGCCCCGKKNR